MNVPALYGRVQLGNVASVSANVTSMIDCSTRLLTVREVAEQLGLMRDTLYHWRMRGEGPRAIKVGGRVRYRQSDVEAWLKTREDQ